MVLLRALPVILLAACYSPDLGDCVVACHSTEDCAPSQLCGTDGMCVSPEGSCKAAASIDAGREPNPSDAPPDAPGPFVKLVVKIEGRGEVFVPGAGTCDGGSGNTECTYDVPKDAPVTLQATPKNNWRFDKWSEACDHQPTATCVLTPDKMLSARARFALTDTVL